MRCEVQSAVLWVAAVALAGTFMFAMQPHTKYAVDNLTFKFQLTEAQNVAWHFFARAGWCLVLMWIVVACNTNNAGLVGRFLSMRAWSPLAKLTFSCYLIHILVMEHYHYSRTRPLHFTTYVYFYNILGLVVVTYMVALPVSLIVELPIGNLSKLFL